MSASITCRDGWHTAKDMFAYTDAAGLESPGSYDATCLGDHSAH